MINLTITETDYFLPEDGRDQSSNTFLRGFQFNFNIEISCKKKINLGGKEGREREKQGEHLVNLALWPIFLFPSLIWHIVV